MKVFPFFCERERTVLLLLFNAAGVIVRVLEFSGYWLATSMLTCHILCYYGRTVLYNILKNARWNLGTSIRVLPSKLIQRLNKLASRVLKI